MTSISNPIADRRYYNWYQSFPTEPIWRPRFTSDVIAWTDSRSGGDRRNYKSVILAHGDATNDMTGTLHRLKHTQGTGIYQYKPNKQVLYNSGDLCVDAHGGFQLHDAVLFQNVRALAVSRMLHKARSVQSSFSAGVFTGELRETINGLLHPLSGLRKGVFEYYANCARIIRTRRRYTSVGNKVRKKIKRQSQRDVEKGLADAFLEFSFGISPLMGDIESAMETLTRPMLQYKRISGRARLRVGSAPGPVERSNQSYRTLCYGRRIFKYSAIARGEVGFANGSIARRKQDWGLIASNFFPTVYQLLPYSWLLDYVSNVADIVEARSSGRVPLTWDNVTTRVECENQVIYKFLDNGVNLELVGSNAGQLMYYRKYVDRTSNIGDGIPPLTFGIPNSIRKYCNLVALAISRRGFLEGLFD